MKLGLFLVLGFAILLAGPARGNEGGSPSEQKGPATRDVVVFKYPENHEHKNYIKRFIDRPAPVRISVEGGRVVIQGDTITIDGGKTEILLERKP